MVMENEIRLGDILDKLTPSDRLVIYNAATGRSDSALVQLQERFRRRPADTDFLHGNRKRQLSQIHRKL